MISLNLELLVAGRERLVRLLFKDHTFHNAWTRLSAKETLCCHLPLRWLPSRPETRHLGNWRTPEVLNFENDKKKIAVAINAIHVRREDEFILS